MATDEMGDRAIPQPPDVAAATVLISVAGFLAFVAVIMTGLFFYLRAEAPRAFKPAVEHGFPEPALQETPQTDLKRFELEQRMELAGYAWVDRAKGVARIPIEDAMRIVAARGEHAYDAPAPMPVAAPPAPGNPGTRP